MAWTQSDIDALKQAIKGGVKTVSYSDRTVTHHSLDEMLRLLSAMEGDTSSGSDGGSRVTYAGFSSD